MTFKYRNKNGRPTPNPLLFWRVKLKSRNLPQRKPSCKKMVPLVAVCGPVNYKWHHPRPCMHVTSLTKAIKKGNTYITYKSSHFHWQLFFHFPILQTISFLIYLSISSSTSNYHHNFTYIYIYIGSSGYSKEDKLMQVIKHFLLFFNLLVISHNDL